MVGPGGARREGRDVSPSRDHRSSRRGRAAEEFSKLAKGARFFGYVGAAVSIYDIASTFYSDYQVGQGFDKTTHVVVEQGAGWLGAIYGGEMGAAAGAEIGAGGGPLGVALGSAGGGLAGSILGYMYGTQAVDNFFQGTSLPQQPGCNWFPVVTTNPVGGCGTSDEV